MIVALLLAGSTATVSTGVSAAQGTSVVDPINVAATKLGLIHERASCQFDARSVPASASLAPIGEEVSEQLAWHADPQADEALQRLHAIVNSAPDVLQGSYMNYRDRQLVLVYNFAAPSSMVADALPAVAALAPALKVSLRPSCVSPERSSTRMAEIERLWLEAGKPGNIGFGFDPASGVVWVGLDQSARAVAFGERVSGLLGADVRVEHKPEMKRLSGGRLVDNSPFFGGARLRIVEASQCTSGFSATVNGTTRTGMVTAGHCFPEGFGSDALNGDSSAFYGRVSNFYFPDPDLALLTDPNNNRTYTNRIYTDPGSPTTRTVDNKTLGTAGNYCVSGSFTGARCGLVYERTGTYCDPDNLCTYSVVYASHPEGVNVVQGGDSGAPAYGRTGPTTTSAQARGVLIAGGGSQAIMHTIGTVEAYLGVKVRTS